MRNYTLRLADEYGISPNRMRELRAFCLQYEEKKAKLSQLYTLSSAPPEVPVMGGTSGKPTESKAILAVQLKSDIKLIDDCLAQAVGDDVGLLAPLKKNITLGVGYDSLGYVPCGRNLFFQYRRKFYFLLDKSKR